MIEKIEDQKTKLLQATYDILKQCKSTPYVQNFFEMTAIWDNATCDGYCLMEEIEELLKEIKEEIMNTMNLTDEEKISLIDQLLSELKVDNLSSCMSASSHRNYKGLLKNGKEIGIVMVENYDKPKNKN